MTSVDDGELKKDDLIHLSLYALVPLANPNAAVKQEDVKDTKNPLPTQLLEVSVQGNIQHLSLLFSST